MGRGPSTFKQADYIRAVKAAKAAGLELYRSEIHRDGRIVLYHELKEIPAERQETYEEWAARTGATIF